MRLCGLLQGSLGQPEAVREAVPLGPTHQGVSETGVRPVEIQRTLEVMVF